jgi:hypothetical protein
VTEIDGNAAPCASDMQMCRTSTIAPDTLARAREGAVTAGGKSCSALRACADGMDR